MRLVAAVAGIVATLGTACSRAPSDTGAAPSPSSDPLTARKHELNRVIPCCRALQERGAASVRATQQCTQSFADLEAGRRTAAEVFRQIAQEVPASDLPAACR